MAPKRQRRKRPETPLYAALEGDDQASAIGRLLQAHPELVAELEGFAQELLGAVDPEVVAEEVQAALTCCDVDDVYAQSGSQPFGYVDPGDMAAEMLEAEMEPYWQRLARRFQIGRDDEARRICEGILRGLYALRDVNLTTDSALGLFSDFPGEAADQTMDLYRNRGAKGRRAKPGAVPPLSEDCWDQIPQWIDMREPKPKRGRGTRQSP